MTIQLSLIAISVSNFLHGRGYYKKGKTHYLRSPDSGKAARK